MKTYTLDELTDKYIGEKGSSEREQFEFELKLNILGEMIKKARKERQLTLTQTLIWKLPKIDTTVGNN